MFKKVLFFSALFVLGLSAEIFAGSSSGCGLGASVWQGQSGVLANFSAVSTNGLSGNQTFGITSSTSGCSSNDVVMKEYESEVFVADNLDILQQNVSQGQGEYVSALGETLGCKTMTSQKAFNSMAKGQYASIFVENASSEQIVQNIKNIMQQNSRVAQQCG